MREPHCPHCGFGSDTTKNKTCDECLAKGLGTDAEKRQWQEQK